MRESSKLLLILAFAAVAVHSAKPQTPTLTDQDVGAPKLRGSITISNDASGARVYTLVGGGNDIWNTGDNFHYAYATVMGDFDYAVRIQHFQGPSIWSKAELMARAPLAPGAEPNGGDPFVANMTTPTGGQNEVALQGRDTRNGECFWTSAFPVYHPTYPQWLRLIRVGNTFTSKASTDGISWTTLGSHGVSSVQYPATLFIGMAVTAQDDSDPNGATCVFSNFGPYLGVPVEITTQPPPTVNLSLNQALSLKVVATGDPIHFQWRKDGQDIPGATTDTYAVTLAKPSDSGIYTVKVYNQAQSIISDNSVVTVSATAVPPTLVSAVGDPTMHLVTLSFSEAVEVASATNLVHYAVNPTLAVTAAVVKNLTNVVLTTFRQTSSTVYIVTVNGVSEPSGVVIAADSKISFTSSPRAASSGAEAIPSEITDPGRSVWYQVNESNDWSVGLQPVSSSEGTIRRLTIGGVPAVTVDPGHYLYLDVAGWFTAPDVILHIQYFDRCTGPVSIFYDSYDYSLTNQYYASGAWKSAGQINGTGSLTWKTAEFHLLDARFGKECNGKDIRVDLNSSGDFPIHTIWLSAVTTNAPIPRRQTVLLDSQGQILETREADDQGEFTLSDNQCELTFMQSGLTKVVYTPTPTLLASSDSAYIPFSLSVRKARTDQTITFENAPITMRVIGGAVPSAIEYVIGCPEMLNATLRIEKGESGLTRWHFSAFSVSPREDVSLTSLTFPDIRGLAIGGDAKDDWFTIPGYERHGAGVYYDPIDSPLPARLSMAMNWLSVYDQTNRCGLGFYLDDRSDLDVYEENQVANGVVNSRLSSNPTPATVPDAYVIVHPGDWHKVADSYRIHVASRDTPPPNPAWAADLDGWDEVIANHVEDGFSFIPDYYEKVSKRQGLKLLDVYRQMFEGPWNYAGVYPYPNPYYGSVEELKEAALRVHDLGGRMIYYINYQRSIPDGPSVKRIGPTPKALIPSNIPPPYMPPGYPQITNRSYTGLNEDQFVTDRSSREWSDRNLFWSTWHAQNLLADGIYWDQLSCVPGGLKETAWNLERSMKEARKYVPNFITAGEGVGQAHGRHLTFGLASAIFHRSELYRFVLPQHLVMDGTANGATSWSGGDRRFNAIFLNGCRFDNVPRDETFRNNMMNLRLKTKQLLYQATFRDTEGIDLTYPSGLSAPSPIPGLQLAPPDGFQAKRFILTNSNSRIILVNVVNTWGLPGAKIAVETSEIGPIRAVWAFPWVGEMRQIPFEYLSDTRISLEAPTNEQATVIVINSCEPVIYIDIDTMVQPGASAKATVSILNLNANSLDGTAGWQLPDGWSSAPIGPYSVPSGETKSFSTTITAATNASRQIYDLGCEASAISGAKGVRYASISVVPTPYVKWEYKSGGVLQLTLQNLKRELVAGSVFLEFPPNSPVGTREGSQEYTVQAGGEVVKTFHFTNLNKLREPMGIYINIQSSSTPQRIPIRVYPGIANGDFEIDMAGDGKPDYWTTYDNSGRTSMADLYPRIALDKNVKYQEGSSLRIDPLPDSFHSSVDVYPLATMLFPDTTYRITAFAKVPTNGNLAIYRPDWQLLLPAGSPTSDGWQKYQREYTAGATIERNGLPIINKGQTPVWIDNIRVEANTPRMDAPPVLTQISEKIVNVGDTLTFAIQASGGQAPFTYSLLPDAPPGTRVDPATGVFTWAPAFFQPAGSNLIGVVVADDGYPPLSATNSFYVTVKPTPRPPILDPIESTSINEGETVRFQVIARVQDAVIPGLLWDRFDGFSNMGGFTNRPAFPDHPSLRSFIFDRLEIESVADNHYAQRLWGLIKPPMTGEYTIWIVSDENAILFVSQDQYPEHRNAIASISNFTPERVWDFEPSQKSSIINLNASNYCYIEILLSQQHTGGRVAVRWQLPDGSIEDPIPGARLFWSQTHSTAMETNLGLIFSLQPGSPPGARIDPVSGVFSWTPSENQGPSTNVITVKVANAEEPLLNDTKSFSVVVKEVNSAPVLMTIGYQVANELHELSFIVGAADSDIPAQALTFSLEGAPDGAKIDPATGRFSWTPTKAQCPSSQVVTVKVTDNGVPPLSDTKTFNIIVNEVNTAPKITTLSDAIISEGTRFQIQARGTDSNTAWRLTSGLLLREVWNILSDEVSLLNLTNTVVNPRWPNNPDIVGTVALFETPIDVADKYGVRLSGFLTAPETGNYTFYLCSDNQGVLFLSSDDTPANKIQIAREPDWNGSREWLKGSNQASRGDPPCNISAPIRLEAGKPYYVEAIMAEAGGGDNLGVAWKTPSQTAPPANGSAPIGSEYLSAIVPVPDQLTYSLVDPPAGATINPITGVIVWTPGEEFGPGLHPIKVRVTDNGTPPLSAETTLKMTVAEVNVAPVLAVPGDRAINELTTLTITNLATDADIPANILTFNLVSGPQGATLNPVTGVLVWTPTEAQGPSTNVITVKVTDNGVPALSDTKSYTVFVKEVNSPPVLNPIGNKTVEECREFTFAATAKDDDIPAQALMFSLDPGAPLGVSINASSGVFTWTPTEAQGPSTNSVTIRVSDGVANVSETIQIVVNEANVAPVLTVPGDLTINELTTLTITNTATDADIPANTLTFSLVSAPQGVTLDPATGVLVWTPTEAQGPSTNVITIKVTDNGVPPLSDTRSFTVIVNEVNSPPVLNPIGKITADEETLVTFTASATDPDIPVQALRFTLDAAPPGAAIDPVTGRFTWTPTEAQGPSTNLIMIRVSDGVTSVVETVGIVVNEVNTAPSLATIGDKTAYPNRELSFGITASDRDLPAQSLVFSLVASPAGAVIDSTNGRFAWTPGAELAGSSHPVIVQVSDNGSPALTAQQTFSINVNSLQGLVLEVPSDQRIDELKTLEATNQVTDPEQLGRAMTFELIEAPAGMVIEASSGRLTWTPAEDQGPSTNRVRVRVHDGGSPMRSATNSFVVTVNEVNSPPVLAAIGNKTVKEMSELTFAATATDEDIPLQTLSFTLDTAPPGAAIEKNTGLFTWMPTANQAPSTNEVVVRVTDDGSPSLSDTKAFTIVVSVAPELRIISVERPVNGQVELRWSAEPGAVYEVVFKEQLSDPVWNSLGQVSSAGDAVTFTNSMGTARQRFYQIKQVR